MAKENYGFLSPISCPELVFGLVAPIGTDLKTVSRILEEELLKVNYKTTVIKLTSLLSELPFEFNLVAEPVEEKYNSYIKAGNTFRKIIDREDAFSMLAVAAIKRMRQSLTGDKDFAESNRVYIVHQLKRPEEIQTLRQVYGRGFVQISCYSPIDTRLDELTQQISKSHHIRKSRDFYRGVHMT